MGVDGEAAVTPEEAAALRALAETWARTPSAHTTGMRWLAALDALADAQAEVERLRALCATRGKSAGYAPGSWEATGYAVALLDVLRALDGTAPEVMS